MSIRMANPILVPIFACAVLLIFQIATNSAFGSPVANSTSDNELVVQDPEEILRQTTPPPFALDGGWTDWETWEASPDIVEAFPYYKVGLDLDGLAVYAVDFGKWDYREWAHKPDEKLEEFWKYFEQFIRRQEKDAVVNDGEGMVQIVDWDEFSLSHHASPKAIKLAMKMFAGLMRVNGFMKYGFYVNVNFSAETFINAMRPFLGAFLEKFEICGTRMEKCKPGIVKKIAADQLPPKYGGSSSDWKPAAFTR